MANSGALAHSHGTETAISRTLDGIVPLAGRVLIAGLFLLSGISKLQAPAGTIAYIESAGLPFATLGYIAALAVEIIGSLALIAGYRTRAVAAIMALFTLAAAFAFHFDLSDQNQFIHFFKNISIAGGLLQIVAFGAGRLSLDARRA
ncbi:DoxX family protein [Stappia sp. F7233]|uniref:DoxX family protein n=1 Tax=Stappia albiluteola TaxID=2758565 RepID=A0A839AI84_9HYPH|nr:DoxX family protein [Stappia albiluteola]MBA5779433.1 DoxX family protein [Stappia albiluteola]